MWFRVFINGFGNVWIRTNSNLSATALSLARDFASQQGFTFPGDSLQTMTVTETAEPPAVGSDAGAGFFSINANGTVTNLTTGSQTAFGETPVPPPATVPVEGDPPVAQPDPIDPEIPVDGGAGDIGDQFDRDIELPASAFRNFLRGQGVAPGGTGGALLANQAAPANTVFNALSGLGFLPEGTSFTDFLGSGQLGSTRFQTLAGEALAGTTFSGDVFPEGGTSFTREAQNVADLSRIAGGRNFGFGFTPTVARVEQRLQDQANAGGTINPEQFLEFLRMQFGRQNRPGSNPTIAANIGRLGALR